jgi:hypothetical protein
MYGHERVFFISMDDSRCVSFWEANQADRTDNGAPITCFVQLKPHSFGSQETEKRFLYAEVQAREILGDVSVMIGVSGTKGAFYRAATKEIVATKGAVYGDSIYDRDTCMYGNRPQTRSIVTQETPDVGFCNTCGIESDTPNGIDSEFSLLVVWSGRLGIVGYTMSAVPYAATNSGTCENNETGPRSLSEQGCSAKSKYITGCAFEKFDGTASVQSYCARTGQTITASATAQSVISQADADRKAAALANIKAERMCECAEIVYYNTLQSYTVFDPELPGGYRTVVIAAGVYSSALSQAEANQLAYAAAKQQAEDGSLVML